MLLSVLSSVGIFACAGHRTVTLSHFVGPLQIWGFLFFGSATS